MGNTSCQTHLVGGVHAMEEVFGKRLRFVSRLLDGEAMSDACREFGISRRPATRVSTAIGSMGRGRPLHPPSEDPPLTANKPRVADRQAVQARPVGEQVFLHACAIG